jgi:hypothetical protein
MARFFCIAMLFEHKHTILEKELEQAMGMSLASHEITAVYMLLFLAVYVCAPERLFRSIACIVKSERIPFRALLASL